MSRGRSRSSHGVEPRIVVRFDGTMTRPHESPSTIWSATRTDVITALGQRIARLPRLIVVHCPDEHAVGRLIVVEIEGDPIVIGRRAGEGSGVSLADKSLSRAHARIEPREGEVAIVDLKSRNGVFVDGRRVDETKLEHGTVIRIGGTLLLYEVAELKPTELLRPAKPPLLGPSLAMQRVRGLVETAAPDSLPVLITGESGVGKELVASELHASSGRKGALVTVNCGALPAELVESELFGSLAGAYTGSTGPREGLFRAAHGGTLLLDEIGELPLSLQPKLLRALSTGEVRPIGSTKSEPVDVRVVAATNREPEAAVAAEEFRGDLLARLKAWEIDVPPLRERKEDILALVHELDELPTRITPDVGEALLLYGWPYNVRELIQTLSAAWVRSGKEEPFQLDHLPDELVEPLVGRFSDSGGSAPIPLALRVRPDVDPDEGGLRFCLTHFQGKVSAVAKYFGRQRYQIYRWCERFGLDPDDFR